MPSLRASRCVLLLIHVVGSTVFAAAGKTVNIGVDQAGYLPAATKIAVVKQAPARTHAAFTVRRSNDDAVVFRGQLGPSHHDDASGDDVQGADFSSVRQPGTYYVDVAGVGKSWKFAVGPDVYDHVYYLAMRSFYGQRCGTAVDLGPDYPRFSHGPCHLIGAFHPSAGREGPHASAKGWHDAGDYGRYVVNSGISTATILWAYELFGGDRLNRLSLNIPESGHGVPDILSEARWNLEWMLSMQDYDGGVFHKQTSDHFSGFIMPERDDLISYVIGTGQKPWKSSCATGDLTAVAAMAARVYRPFDPAFAAVALKSANLGWAWLQANPDVSFSNPAGVTTGAYDDRDCSDERLWAAAELGRSTGERSYLEYVAAHFQSFLPTIRPTQPSSWNNMAPLALWSYSLSNGTDPAISTAIQTQTQSAAQQIVQRTLANPYRVALTTEDYIWGSNGVAANYAMLLLIANRFHPDASFVLAANDQLHYILGTNTFSLSWVTQVGEHFVMHPHHRPSVADGLSLPWPGLMSGGPNAGRQDKVMQRLVPQSSAPARAYVDDSGAYACNEVAINWNAPLVFALAGMLQAP